MEYRSADQVSFDNFVETVYYGQFSTPASIASQLAASFSRDYIASGLCAKASGSKITFQLKGAATFGAVSVVDAGTTFGFTALGFGPSTTATPGGNASNFTVVMTGGQSAGTFYDSGTLTANIGGTTAWVDWTEGSTPVSLASGLASAINTAAGGIVNATPVNGMVIINSLGVGPETDLAVSASVADTNSQLSCWPNCSPSFSVASSNMTGGSLAEGSTIYNFTIPEQGGFAPNGNVLSVTDSIMGQWNYTYDYLNRLKGGSAVTSTAPGVLNNFAGTLGAWTYDAFGNRTGETWSGSSGTYVPGTTSVAYAPSGTTPTTNQIYSSNGTQFQYDAAGDVTYDGMNSYKYDAEGRLCAMQNQSGITGYIYDGAGTRVARGSLLPSFSCSFSSNGFVATTSWALDHDGAQVTEYAVKAVRRPATPVPGRIPMSLARANCWLPTETRTPTLP